MRDTWRTGLIIAGSVLTLALSGPATTAVADPLKIVFVGDSSASDPLWTFNVSVLQEAAKAAGADFSFQFAAGDFAKQAQLMEQAVASGATALIAPMWDENLFVAPVTDAATAGVKVYGVMGMAPKQKLSADIQAKVGWDDIDLVKWGGKVAELTFDLIPDGGTIMWPAEVPSATYITEAIQGYNAYFSAHNKKVTIDVIETSNDATTATSRIAAYLTSHPNTSAVITSGAIAADSAAVAEQQMGLAAGKIPVIGQVVSPNAAAAITSGIMPMGVNLDMEGAMKAAVNDLVAMSKGTTPPHRNVDFIVIHKDNLEASVPPGLRS